VRDVPDDGATSCCGQPVAEAAGQGHPASSFTFYDTSNSVIENNLSLDGQHSSSTTTANFYMPAHYIGCDGNKWLGNIAMNNAARSGIELDPGANYGGGGWSCHNQLVENNVLWSGANGAGIGINVGQSSNGASYLAHVSVNRNTVGMHDTSGRGINIHHGRGANNSDSVLNLSYSMFYDYSDYVTGNGSNNLDANTLGVDPQLNHIAEIEAGSPAANAGSDGGNIGATVVERYQDGVLTATPLWPFQSFALCETRVQPASLTSEALASEASRLQPPSHYDSVSVRPVGSVPPALRRRVG